MRLRHAISVVVLGAMLMAGPALAYDGTTLERIEAAYQAGEIDEDQYILYRLMRVVDKGRLPAALVAPAEQERPVRCATPMVRAARRASAWMDPGDVAVVEELLPARRGSRSTSYESEHFSLIVGDDYTGSQADIDFWLAAFEESWDVEVDQLGFDNPPCTNQYYFDVQIANTGADMPTMEEDTYGYCDHYQTDCPFVVVHPDYSFAGDHEGSAQITAAHEFQHGIQSGYDWFEGDYWMEATATWAEDLVFDDVNGYLEYVNGDAWMAYPEYSLTYEDGWHEYGNVIWVKYLSETHGDEAVRDIWEGSRDNATMLDAVSEVTGSMDDTFIDFTAVLAVNGFEEGDLYDPVYKMAEITGYPFDGTPPQYFPRQYGSNYIVFYPEGEADTLYVEFDGVAVDAGSPVTWGLALVEVSGGSAVYTVLEADADGDASGTVADFGGSVDHVVLAISVLDGDADSTPGVEYAYSADVGAAPPTGDDDDGAGDEEGGGCGCRADRGAAATPLLLMVLLAVTLIRRRRE